VAPVRKRQNHPQPEPGEIANSIDYGLSTALDTPGLNRTFAAIRDLEAGITYVNAPTIGAEVHLPFGGVKHTGNGHREGLGALDFFTTWKSVYVDYSGKPQRAQIDNAECGMAFGRSCLFAVRSVYWRNIHTVNC
jgi:delta 1-pyrroline-5-carboxylate dehydrogenase